MRILPFILLLTLSVLLGSTGMTQHAIGKELMVELKKLLIEGHRKSCISTIGSKYPDISNKKLEDYCLCLGGKYFGNFSVADFDYMKKHSTLPPRISNKRTLYQNVCADKAQI